MNCTRCSGEGFINLHQIPDEDWKAIEAAEDFHKATLAWIEANSDHDVSVCDCCGDGEKWYTTPGEHGNPHDPEREPFPECF